MTEPSPYLLRFTTADDERNLQSYSTFEEVRKKIFERIATDIRASDLSPREKLWAWLDCTGQYCYESSIDMPRISPLFYFLNEDGESDTFNWLGYEDLFYWERRENYPIAQSMWDLIDDLEGNSSKYYRDRAAAFVGDSNIDSLVASVVDKVLEHAITHIYMDW